MTTSSCLQQTLTLLASTTFRYLGKIIQISFISLFKLHPSIFIHNTASKIVN